MTHCREKGPVRSQTLWCSLHLFVSEGRTPGDDGIFKYRWLPLCSAAFYRMQRPGEEDLGWRAVCLKSDLSPKLNMNKEELSPT